MNTQHFRYSAVTELLHCCAVTLESLSLGEGLSYFLITVGYLEQDPGPQVIPQVADTT